ncbi:MAG: diguanylate cyclase [Thermoleophilaceae bacterium]|nr:diguanylate cyclase [Thermoleophilaceae bacterium]
MRSTDSPTESPRGSARRLSRHVLTPLVALGLLAVLAAAAAATVTARSAAIHTLDARAATIRDVGEASLRRTGNLGPAAIGARRESVKLHVSVGTQPLPGGRAVKTRGGNRVYTFTVRTKHGNRRLRVTVPAASVDRATLQTATISLGAGALVLALLLLAVGGRLRRAATRPLRRLAAAVELLAAGEPADVSGLGGAKEVRSISGRLHGLATAIAELTAQATTDPLTGIANRRSFYTSLEAELKRAERTATPVTLVLIDLDGFKEINDTHGHPFGDGVLQTIAEKLRRGLRATDVLARVGGDEFAILLPATPRDNAATLITRARDEAAASVGGVSLTWSAGVATYPTDARESATLVECADAALYCAKAAGQSTICNYDPETAQAPHPGGDLAAVQAVLDEPDGVVPVFQPLVSLATGQVSGYEALARFPHPPARRPDEWFAVAQRVGLGPELEARAVRAATQASGRPAGTFLSFNLSASALMSDAAIAAMPSDLSDIVIEITENERVGDDERLAARLEPLRKRGARIAVDDAGAGYSGLQQVMRIQPDIIKLDRSLVANVDTDPAKAALIDSFVRFARRTGASVCAEGIETPEELKVLADLDVTYGQGFGLARPAEPWAPVGAWVPGALRSRTPRIGIDGPGSDPTEENSDLRLASLTSQLANVRSSDDLRGLGTLVAAELGADEVAYLRRGAQTGTLEALSDQPWLPAGSVLGLANYPTLRQILATQQVVQVLLSDATADLGELSLLGRSGHGSMLLAPLVAHGEVAGVMVALKATERPWTRAETSRARIVGHQLGAVADALGASAQLVELPPQAPPFGALLER